MKGEVLQPPPEGGIALNLKSDVLHVRMASEGLQTDAGNLAGAKADVTRLRLILEGERAFAIGHEGTLTPALEVGLRHDAGDAETGTGVEVGGRIAYARPGVAIEGAVRALAAHEDAGYEEWGASASVRIDPGRSGRGLSFTVTPTWGNAGSGTGQIWGASDPRELAPESEFEAGRRLETEVGYGLGARLGVVTPFVGVGLGDGGERTLRLGARWALAPGADLHLEGARSETGEADAEQRTGLTFSARW